MSKLNRINAQRPIVEKGRAGFIPTIEFFNWIQAVQNRLGIADVDKIEEATGAAIAPATTLEAGRVLQAVAVAPPTVVAVAPAATTSTSNTPPPTAAAAPTQMEFNNLAAVVLELQAALNNNVTVINETVTTATQLVTDVTGVKDATVNVIQTAQAAGQRL